MIAIKSNKELNFTDGRGIVTMTIDMIINRPGIEQYEMRLIDTCTKETTVNEVTTTTFIGARTRFKVMTYSELDALYESLNMDGVNLPMREKINESFRQGLLAVTQKECADGIYGDPGRGQYNSEAQDWFIIRPIEVENILNRNQQVEEES